MQQTSSIDLFVSETADDSEWDLAGWFFTPGDSAWSGRMELEGKNIGPISCGWPRPDVLAAFPAESLSADLGFRAQVILPPGLDAGAHRLELVFYNRIGAEIGRIPRDFTIKKGTPAVPFCKPPVVVESGPRAMYLEHLEKAILGLSYADDRELMLCQEGRDWPQFAHSMMGVQRLRHLRACAETVLAENVPGDFIETGVWRGGGCILLRGVLHAYNDVLRTVWVADSFEGLPSPNPGKYPADDGDTLHTRKELAVSRGQVAENFRSYGLLDGQVKFLKGWFSGTLPQAPVSSLAILRLDGDMYESTMDALAHLYPRLSSGGFCIIDDYGCIPACRQAVRDYRAAHDIKEPVAMIDWTGAWWRKS